MDKSRPLDGVTVVALEQAVAAPLCSARMADAGARVIKVERREGDFARGYDAAANGLASYFVWLNRGKESIILDLKEEGDLALMTNMIGNADVFIQNLAPGAVDRLGLNPKRLRAQHGGLITVAISGYGANNEYQNRKAYDLLVQAESGLASVTGAPSEPGRVGVSVCDIACGMNAYAAVLEALLARARTGKGRAIEISLFDSLADWLTVPLLQYQASGAPPARVGLHHVSIAPYGLYDCRDGALLLAIQNEREWGKFCRLVLNDACLQNDPRFESNTRRVENRAALDSLIGTALGSLAKETAIKKLDEAGVAFAVLNDMQGLAEHPVLRRMEVDTPNGAVSIPVSPLFRRDKPIEVGPAPGLGQHSDALRAEFGG